MTDMEIPQEVVRVADRAYWDKYGTQGVVELEDGDAESLVSMRAALEAVLPHLLTEVKSMCETATAVALKLGRQEAAEEIAAAIDLKRDQRSYDETVGEWSEVSRGGVLLGLKEAAAIARSMSSRLQEAASNGLTASSRHPGTPEDTKPPQAAVPDLTPEHRQRLLRVPTHDADGNRIPEWEREYLSSRPT